MSCIARVSTSKISKDGWRQDGATLALNSSQGVSLSESRPAKYRSVGIPFNIDESEGSGASEPSDVLDVTAKLGDEVAPFKLGAGVPVLTIPRTKSISSLICVCCCETTTASASDSGLCSGEGSP